MIELLAGDKYPKETNKSIQACNDWLRLGPGRTVPLLLEQYEFLPENTSPTKSINTLYKWHTTYSWKERAILFDEQWEAFKNAEHENTMQMGLALTHERVRKLIRLATFLDAQLYEQSEPNEDGISTYLNVWVNDVKQIGSGEFAERVDIERFNSSLISEYRSTLDDIAKEVGGRVKKNEHTGADGGELTIKVVYEDTLGSDD